MVGSVVSTKVDESHNSIEIEFFDKSLHKDIRFSDPYKFTMSSLSNLGCLFGSNPASDLNYDSGIDKSSAQDSSSSAFILYRAFKGWAGQSDWSFKFDNKEYIHCLALSNNGAAIYTSLNVIRFLSVGGVQVWVESVPSNILCCVSKDNLLFSVFQNNKAEFSSYKSSTSGNNCTYEWDLRKVSNGEKILSGTLPVSADSKITWVGFSEECLPLVCDSVGVLRCLTRFQSGTTSSWIPIFDAKSSSKKRMKKESYWPVGSFESKFLVAILKGNSSYPPIPRPVLSELDLNIPLLHSESATSAEEQNYLIKSITNKENSFISDTTNSHENMESESILELDKLLLGSINAACKAEKLMRALDLVMMLHRQDSLIAAEKIAVFHKNEALAQRIIKIRTSKVKSTRDSRYHDEDDDGDDDDISDEDEQDDEDDQSVIDINDSYQDSGVEMAIEKNSRAKKNQSYSHNINKKMNGKESQFSEINENSSFINSANQYPESLLTNKENQGFDKGLDYDSLKESTNGSNFDTNSLTNLSENSEIQRKRNANIAFNPFAMKFRQSGPSASDSSYSSSIVSENLSSSGKKVKSKGNSESNSFNPFDSIKNKLSSPSRSTTLGSEAISSSKSKKVDKDDDEETYKPSLKNQTLLASFSHVSAKK
ncbi:Minichromosome loss protein 1 [Smittium culicis]|uniref:Minichromosome loss protein 1 n=1 Tax=Smittium culicis TaxID=133412 RepID=A0A1R1XY92_9FUNG|nr:Minichromosome loss protein 1 [Smittium culicis]